jgi:4-oxalocrotonate tautomerase
MYAKSPYTVMQRAVHVHTDGVGAFSDDDKRTPAAAMICARRCCRYVRLDGAARRRDEHRRTRYAANPNFAQARPIPEYLNAILEGVYLAMREAFNVPEDDRFMIITEHDEGDIVFGAEYLGIPRTDGLIIIQITANNTRTVDQKKALYKRIAERLASDPGVRPEDVFVNIVEVPKENWSFGRGIAQYA